MKEKLLNQRVVLNNPYGYDNYQGTVTRVYMIGNEEWADIDWDDPVLPCYPKIETKHLILISMRYETPHYKMKNLINNINCWRLNRLMIKASTLDAKIERLGIKIERWEKLNIKEL